MVCNPSDLRSYSLKGVPTAQNCLLKSVGVFGCDLSEEPLKNLAKASDFQAEYEGSIPFTRSNSFQALLWRPADFIPTKMAPSFDLAAAIRR